MAVLITAGATRNPVDAVRLLTANASGRTGVGIARALVARGVDIHLLGSAEARLRAPDLPGDEFGSTRDLMARMERWIRDNPRGAVVHSSAVGDYEVAQAESGDAKLHKIPSGQEELVLRLTRTPKIADHVRAWGLIGPFVTFKAAGPDTTDDQLLAIAAAQRERTGCDLVFANVLGRIDRDVALVDAQPTWFSARETAVAALVEQLCHRLDATGPSPA